MCIPMPQQKIEKEGIYDKQSEYKSRNWRPSDLHFRNSEVHVFYQNATIF